MDVEPEEQGPETFESVVESVRSWAGLSSLPDGDPVRRLRDRIDRDLNEDVETEWEADVVELGHQSGACEIIVNGAIGIRFITDFNPGRMQRFDHRLPAQSDRYNYLLVYLHELPRQYQDGWRVRQRKFSASRLGLRDFEFVVRSKKTDEDGTQVDHETMKEVVKTLGFPRMVLLVAILATFVASAFVYDQFYLVLLLVGAALTWFLGVMLYLRHAPDD